MQTQFVDLELPRQLSRSLRTIHIREEAIYFTAGSGMGELIVIDDNIYYYGLIDNQGDNVLTLIEENVTDIDREYIFDQYQCA